MVKSSKFKMGDLIVSKYTGFDPCVNICRVVDMEYIDELHEFWIDGYDEEPYYLYEAKVIYSKGVCDSPFNYVVGDVMCFEDADALSITDYFAQKKPLEKTYFVIIEKNTFF